MGRIETCLSETGHKIFSIQAQLHVLSTLGGLKCRVFLVPKAGNEERVGTDSAHYLQF